MFCGVIDLEMHKKSFLSKRSNEPTIIDFALSEYLGLQEFLPNFVEIRSRNYFNGDLK